MKCVNLLGLLKASWGYYIGKIAKGGILFSMQPKVEISRYLNIFVKWGSILKIDQGKLEKNCLHTACENGNVEICSYILQDRKDTSLIIQVDKHDQNVGHFTAKSGNIDILGLLITHLRNTTMPNLLQKPTNDNINILHIACRHARFEMCVKIADTFPNMISEITEKGWNAALFITEKAGAEKERIEILGFLETRKLNVYHVSRSGKTILYNACVNRSPKLVKHLLKRYPELLNIEKAMDSRKAAKSPDIENIFINHCSEKYKTRTTA